VNQHVQLSSPTGRVVIATTVLGTAVAMLTGTVVNVALPSLASELGASTAEQQWVVNAYLLVLASLILIGGSLGDRYGRVKVYRIGVIWFAVTSLIAAVAPTIEVLIGARLLMGIGGALLTPGSLAIIEATLVHRDRGKGVGLWSGLTGIAAAVGPLVGGALIEISWRWVFLINLPVALAVILLSPRVPETSDESASETRLDLAGAFLAALALGGITFGIIQGPAGGFAFVDGLAVGVGGLALALLVPVERMAEEPMVPFRLFANRPFTAANLVTLLVYGGMGIVFFLLSIQLQVTAGWTPFEAGLALVPATILLLLFSAQSGSFAQRIGPRIPLSIGPVLIAGGMLLMGRIGPDATYVSDVLPAVVVFGAGLVVSVAPVTATALESVPDQRSGAASGANNAIARTGQLLAVAAVPPLVGLTGDALNSPAVLNAGFADAMIVGAGLVGAGAIVAALGLRSDDLTEDEEELEEVSYYPSCPIDGTHPSPVREPETTV
jgi:EmrB/QacA subfamily drug resistance transporter